MAANPNLGMAFARLQAQAELSERERQRRLQQAQQAQAIQQTGLRGIERSGNVAQSLGQQMAAIQARREAQRTAIQADREARERAARQRAANQELNRRLQGELISQREKSQRRLAGEAETRAAAKASQERAVEDAAKRLNMAGTLFPGDAEKREVELSRALAASHNIPLPDARLMIRQRANQLAQAEAEREARAEAAERERAQTDRRISVQEERERLAREKFEADQAADRRDFERDVLESDRKFEEDKRRFGETEARKRLAARRRSSGKAKGAKPKPAQTREINALGDALAGVIRLDRMVPSDGDIPGIGFIDRNEIKARKFLGAGVGGGEAVKIRAQAQEIFSSYKKLITGAAVTKIEGIELGYVVPKPGDSEADLRDKMVLYREKLEEMIRRRKAVLKSQGVDVSSFEAAAPGAPGAPGAAGASATRLRAGDGQVVVVDERGNEALIPANRLDDARAKGWRLP